MASAASVTLFVLGAFLLLQTGARANSLVSRLKRQWVVPGGWDNDYHQMMTFSCEGTRAISAIASHHDNGYEDRVFNFGCRDLPAHDGSDVNWYTPDDYQNNWDGHLSVRCPDNAIITGAVSYYDSGRYDRRWKFTCMQVEGLCWSRAQCEWTSRNDWDADINIAAKTDYFFIAVDSYHHDDPEDRRWAFERCKLVPGNCFSFKNLPTGGHNTDNVP